MPSADKSPIDTIEGGATRGENLFHSFQAFNIAEGRDVYFANPAGIATILSRVTGQNPSDISGTLGVLGQADLFLINPNGIIFGENAQLDVGGSFVATTANAIAFPSGGVFSQNSAVEPQTPLLTIAPSALLFNQVVSQPAHSIAVRGNLSVDEAQSLLLIGGNAFPEATATGRILIDGGTLRSPGGRIEVGGLAAPGTVGLSGVGLSGVGLSGVGLSVDSRNPSLNIPTNTQRADVAFDNGALADVSASDSGDIVIYAQDLSIRGLSEVRAGIAAQRTDNGSAGDIKIDAIGNIDIAGATSSTQRSGIVNSVESGSVGQGGDIDITTGSLSVTGGAQLNTSSRGVGNAGNVVVNARDAVNFEGGEGEGIAFASSRAYARVERSATGQAGDIRITANAMSVNTGAIISASTLGQGSPGNVVLDIQDQVTLADMGPDDLGGIYSRVSSGAASDRKGSIRINVAGGSISVTNGAVIDAGTDGEGDAGNIVVTARETASFEGGQPQTLGRVFQSSGVFSRVGLEGVGQAGDILIRAGTLSLTDGAVITATTQGEGDSGRVIVEASDLVELDGKGPDGFGGLYSRVLSNARGVGGDIQVTVTQGSLFVRNGAELSTITRGEGDAGDIVISARDTVSFDGVSLDRGNGTESSRASSQSRTRSGQSGNIRIETGALSVTDGAFLGTTTFEEGSAGSVTIHARDQVTLDGVGSPRGFGGIYSQLATDAVGNGGNVEITVTNGSLLITNDAQIETVTRGVGNGGDIIIHAGSLRVENGGILTSSTLGRGDAGSLRIEARDAVTFVGMATGSGNTAVTSKVGRGYGEGAISVLLLLRVCLALRMVPV
ncbi:MAG: filamentous hemagglutinin N-terminal domain-containing protein [Phormidesmis sp. RL_2_1]|nr:filamentous hemagglutinin N-terminal domain-containing protein [Phormidesmis sp. RL_2_1]